MTNVLLLEPYMTGSHKAWAHGYSTASDLNVSVRSLPGRFWKWRMHGAAVSFAQEDHGAWPDALLCSDMLDLATFLGLTRGRHSATPAVLYMHENQLAYPTPEPDDGWSDSRRRRAERRDEHYPFINLTSVLAADVVAWNSRYNRDSFLEALPAFLRSFPDRRDLCSADDIERKSVILPVGLELAFFDGQRPSSVPGDPPQAAGSQRGSGLPRIVWNHRWEHDKDPETFFRALRKLDALGTRFEVVLLGESFVRTPPVFEAMQEFLGPRLVHFGHADDRADYARLLWESDVVVSTARHEFFGVSVCEAVHCGCMPVLPNRLAYPELVPSEHANAVLYDDFDGLVERMQRGLESRDHEVLSALQASVKRFDWARVAPAYDDLLTCEVNRPLRRDNDGNGRAHESGHRVG